MARALQPVFKEKFNVELVVKNSAGGGRLLYVFG